MVELIQHRAFRHGSFSMNLRIYKSFANINFFIPKQIQDAAVRGLK